MLEEKLFELADEEYKKFHSSLCPGINNIIGVRVPILRKFAKELAKQNWREVLNSCNDKYYEEILLQGMLIGIVEMGIEERLEYLSKFIPKIDNWAVCDIACSGLKFIRKKSKSNVGIYTKVSKFNKRV